MPQADNPLDLLPPPPLIHQRMGQLYRELTLLRRLLRLSQAARDERSPEPTARPGVADGR